MANYWSRDWQILDPLLSFWPCNGRIGLQIGNFWRPFVRNYGGTISIGPLFLKFCGSLLKLWFSFSPHLLVGFLFLILYPASSASSSSAASAPISLTQLCHTPSLTHNFVTHNFVTHHLSHTRTHTHTFFDTTSFTQSFTHTQLCHKPSLTHNFVSHNFVTHNLVIHHLTPSLSHTFLDTPSFTHNFFAHHLSHTTLSHTIFPSFTHSRTPSFTHNFVTHHLCRTPSLTHHLSHTHTTLSHTIFHTQLCHTPSFTQLCHTPSLTQLCHPQLCHTPSVTFVLRSWRGTCGTGLALVARFGRRWRPGTLRGRRGAWCHPPSFHVAGVALGDIFRFTWLAWHLATSTLFCVAGVALAALGWPLWQAWRLVTSTFV